MRRQTIVYISGPMSGIPGYNHDAFKIAKQMLQVTGAIVLSPHEQPLGLSYESYMDIAMANIRACDKVIMLDGWSQSPGAFAEVKYAQALGKDIEGSAS